MTAGLYSWGRRSQSPDSKHRRTTRSSGLAGVVPGNVSQSARGRPGRTLAWSASSPALGSPASARWRPLFVKAPRSRLTQRFLVLTEGRSEDEVMLSGPGRGGRGGEPGPGQARVKRFAFSDLDCLRVCWEHVPKDRVHQTRIRSGRRANHGSARLPAGRCGPCRDMARLLTAVRAPPCTHRLAAARSPRHGKLANASFQIESLATVRRAGPRQSPRSLTKGQRSRRREWPGNDGRA